MPSVLGGIVPSWLRVHHIKFRPGIDDPALLVPKRFGIGYTLNFGNPWFQAVLALIFLFVLLAVALPFILFNPTVRHLPK
jgi:hypothetical protein